MIIFDNCELVIDEEGTIWVNNNKNGACLLRVSKIHKHTIEVGIEKEYFDITSKE
ncbi:hypothetical protein LCGC14_0547830 [marine sediment metagenome]|uniref:Uncharacterized protein n=1 Tax=marine sediment metagenome TaxID=412755 RepID=A0A0F9UC99_9ZZZZ